MVAGQAPFLLLIWVLISLRVQPVPPLADVPIPVPTRVPSTLVAPLTLDPSVVIVSPVVLIPRATLVILRVATPCRIVILDVALA